MEEEEEFILVKMLLLLLLILEEFILVTMRALLLLFSSSPPGSYPLSSVGTRKGRTSAGTRPSSFYPRQQFYCPRQVEHQAEQTSGRRESRLESRSNRSHTSRLFHFCQQSNHACRKASDIQAFLSVSLLVNSLWPCHRNFSTGVRDTLPCGTSPTSTPLPTHFHCSCCGS